MGTVRAELQGQESGPRKAGGAGAGARKGPLPQHHQGSWRGERKAMGTVLTSQGIPSGAKTTTTSTSSTSLLSSPPALCAASSDPSSQHALPLRHLGPGKFLLKPSRSSSKFPPLRSLPIPPAGGGSCCSLMSRQPAESGLWRQTRPGSTAPAV